MSLRKAAKANWHWDCSLCEYTSRRSPDRFGAELFGYDHEQGYEHLGNALAAAFEPVGKALGSIMDAFAGIVTSVMDSFGPAMEQINYALAPPPNVPHDPAQRRDKRVWGGR